MDCVGCFVHFFVQLHSFSKQQLRKWGKLLLNTGLDTGIQIAQGILNCHPVKKAAKLRAKAAGKSILSGALYNITQQGRGRKVLKCKRKATPERNHLQHICIGSGDI